MARPRKQWNPLLSSYPFSSKINKCSLGAECLYVRLIAQADDNGNYWAGPGMVTGKLFTARLNQDEVSPDMIGGWIDELEKHELVRRYIVKDEAFMNVTDAFKKKRKDMKADIRCPVPEFLEGLKKKQEDEEKAEIIFKENVSKIIDHFNKVTGSKLRSNSESHREPIRGRLRDDKYRVEDLLVVIDHKVSQWGKDNYMSKYLRPQTIFGKSKFDGYLNEALKWREGGKRMNLGTGIYKGQAAKDDYEAVVR